VAVVRQTSATAVGSDSNTVTVNKPSGLAAGDLMILVVNTRGNPWTVTTSPSTGAWTTIAEYIFVAGSVGVSTRWRIADAGDAGAASFTWTSPIGVKWTAVIARYTGHHATVPIGDHAGGGAASGTASMVAPAVAGTLDGAVFCDWFSRDIQSTFSTVSTLAKIDGTTTGGLTTGGGGSNATSTTQGKTLTAGGSTGTFTTTAGAAEIYTSYTIAIEPVTVAAAPPMLTMPPISNF